MYIIWICIYTCVYIYIYMCVCVCVCISFKIYIMLYHVISKSSASSVAKPGVLKSIMQLPQGPQACRLEPISVV